MEYGHIKIQNRIWKKNFIHELIISIKIIKWYKTIKKYKYIIVTKKKFASAVAYYNVTKTHTERNRNRKWWPCESWELNYAETESELFSHKLRPKSWDDTKHNRRCARNEYGHVKATCDVKIPSVKKRVCLD